MRLVTLVVLLLVLCLASSEAWLFKDNEYVKMFQTFLTKFKKAYSTSKFAERLMQFKKNMDKITELNKKRMQQIDEVAYGVNQFSDLSKDEWLAKYTGSTDSPASVFLEGASGMFTDAEEATEEEMSDAALDAAFKAGFDWTKKAVLGPARQQHECGSCWAFASVATVEAAIAIKNGKRGGILSPQMLVDCATDCASGCISGHASCAYKYMRDTGYFADAANPYKNRQQSTCPDKSAKPVGKISNALKTQPAAAAFIKHVKTVPLLVTMHAGPLQFYKSGVVGNNTGCPNMINHAVVLVGYGATTGGAKYYKIRNSWGSDWGEAGHFRISAEGNVCAIHKYGGFLPVL
jgi:C1A family cysteine protease